MKKAIFYLFWAVFTVPVTALFILVVASWQLFRRELKPVW